MTFRSAVLSGLALAGLSAASVAMPLPAMADDVVIDRSGVAGSAGSNGQTGGAGGAADPTTFVEDGALTAESGGNGDPGEPGDPGTGGTGGGAVQLVTTASTNGSIVITANGGEGGAGGKGGQGGGGGTGANVMSDVSGRPVIGSKGGSGGNGGVGGKGGDGGAAGSISLIVNSTVAGDIDLSATGGAAGEGGMGGQGGRGGNGGITQVYDANVTLGEGGDGGDGAVAGVRGVFGTSILISSSFVHGSVGVDGQSLPEQYNGADGATGAGGSITVRLSASVGGNVTANAGTGTVSVTLNTGASVGGTISANDEAQSALRFAMKVESRADYKAAKAALRNADALSGSITINGQTYIWTGFDQLVQALVFAGVRSSAISDTGAPVYLSCSPRAVTAFYSGGGIELIASRTDERGAFRIGTVLGQSFVSQNDAGWTVRFDASARGIRFDVLDRSGSIAATCN